MDGVAGLAKTGVKDLSYKLVFIANSVHAHDSRFGQKGPLAPQDEFEEEDNIAQFTHKERQTVVSMRDDEDLLTRLAESIAP